MAIAYLKALLKAPLLLIALLWIIPLLLIPRLRVLLIALLRVSSILSMALVMMFVTKPENPGTPAVYGLKDR